MLIVFKSSTCGDVVMLERNGKEMLGVLGKSPDDGKGIVTLEQLPGAISALKAAIEADKAAQAMQGDREEEASDKGGAAIHFFQRAVPLLGMLERSLKDQVPVTWGV